MDLVTGAALLTFVGVRAPDPDQAAWADDCAAAVNVAIEQASAPYVIDAAHPGIAELTTAAMLAGAELYKRREAPFGALGYAGDTGALVRLARDHLTGVRPLLDRWHPSGGVVIA